MFITYFIFLNDASFSMCDYLMQLPTTTGDPRLARARPARVEQVAFSRKISYFNALPALGKGGFHAKNLPCTPKLHQCSLGFL